MSKKKVKAELELSEEFKGLTTFSPKTFNSLVAYMPEHSGMLATIKTGLPEIQRATSLFGKTQSQFMDNMLTISHPTPLRNIRQILAEMNKAKEALRESHIKIMRKEVEIKIKQRDFDKELSKKNSDEFKLELIKIDILELMSNLEVTKTYISGAIRKLANYQTQYDSILETMGVSDFSEINFEEEEENYHIMKAFEQALTAARSRNGTIDEGNLIYLSQIGINGASAQREVYTYLAKEGKVLTTGEAPSYDMQLSFLKDMVSKFKGSAKRLASYKGMSGTYVKEAALQKGDTRLIDKK